MNNRFLSLADLDCKVAQEQKAKAPNTTLARVGDLKYFWKWAELTFNQVEHYPTDPDLVEAFVVLHVLNRLPDAVRLKLAAKGYFRNGMVSAGDSDPNTDKAFKAHKLSTIIRRLDTLKCANENHLSLNETNPASRERFSLLLKGASTESHNALKQAAPLTRDHLFRLIDACETSTLVGLRDRAMLAVGYASGGRRVSELLNLMVADIEPADKLSRVGESAAYNLCLRATKTSISASQDFDKSIEGIAAIFLNDWLAHSQITDGLLFPGVRNDGRFVVDKNGKRKKMTTQGFAKRIQCYAKRAGYFANAFSPHSLRSGFVTDAINDGIPVEVIKRRTDHKSDAAFARYIRKIRNGHPVMQLMDR